MHHLVIIGDVVASRQTADRQRLQSRLENALSAVNRRQNGIASPYTLTLGDEFQAVLSDPRRVWRDALQIQAAVHPLRVRFSMAVGEITTQLNPIQAIGMDGPAFHRARDGIEAMKAGGALFRVQFPMAGVQGASADLANASLSLISQLLGKWRTRRVAILGYLLDGDGVRDIAARLEVSEQAVYKNVSDGRLNDVLGVFDAIGRLMESAQRET